MPHKERRRGREAPRHERRGNMTSVRAGAAGMEDGMDNRAFDYSRWPDWINPADVTPYERNAKEHPDEQIKIIANSIKRFGWQQDCVITRDNVLMIGHGRRLAAMQIGCKMPVHRVDKDADELTDEEINALRLADNKTNESAWNFETLDAELQALDMAGMDMTEFGFDQGAVKFEAFDGEGDGGGSQINNGTKVRVVIGALMFDIDDADHAIYAKTKEADAETIKAQIVDMIERGELF